MKRKTCEHGTPKANFCAPCIDEYLANFHILPDQHGDLDMTCKPLASDDLPPRADFQHLQFAVTDHAAAAAEALGKLQQRLLTGETPEDIGPEVILLGRLLARRT